MGRPTIRRVLIVEDDEGLNKLAQKALRRAGFHADGVLTGAEAVERVAADAGWALLLDQKLPDMTGTEVIQSLMDRGCRVPFVAMTGHGDERTAVEMMKLGARDYLTKGLDLPDLLPEVFRRLFRELETERRLARAEEALRDSEKLFRTVFEQAAVGVAQVMPDGRFMNVNDRFCEIVGYTKDEMRALTFRDITHPEDLYLDEENVARVVGGETDAFEIEKRYLHKDGHAVWIKLFSNVVRSEAGEVRYAVAAVTDITRSREAEGKLRESEERYRTILETAPISIIIFKQGVIEYVNEAGCAIMGGKGQEDFKGRSVFDFVHPDSKSFIERRAANLKEGRFNPPADVKAVRLDGEPVFVQSTSLPFTYQGEPAVLLMSVDITERKRAETALRESERQKDLILNSTAEMVTYYDNDLRVIWANRASGESVGKSPEELAGAHCYEVWHRRHEPCKECPVLQARDAKAPRQGEMRTPDGRYWLLRGYPVLDDAGEVVALVELGQDVTEHKLAEEERQKLQAQLTQAQKMESVGRLAGGVAHDFNNMLSVIMGHTEMALHGTDPAHPIHAKLREIHKAAQRSANLTRQLLAFARKQMVTPRVLDLNETIEGMLKMLRRLIGEDIDLVWSPSTGLWPVKMDPSQIDQILANLCVNARDAIRGVGKIGIETANVVLDKASRPDPPEFVPGEYVSMAVSDNGCGMDGETLERLFEPFFTTKGVGEGTGLGLATVYGIVKQNNGFIDVDSKPGRGTTLKIYLPRHATRVEKSREEDSGPLPGGGHETVLLVEDEPSILAMTSAMLKHLGYTALTAAAPEEALRLAEEHAGEIHLLVTDVIMPKMNGRELATKLQSLYPHMACLFMSGYTANVIAAHGVLDDGMHFIQKPFSMRGLGTKVREALDGEKRHVPRNVAPRPGRSP